MLYAFIFILKPGGAAATLWLWRKDHIRDISSLDFEDPSEEHLIRILCGHVPVDVFWSSGMDYISLEVWESLEVCRDRLGGAQGS